MTMQKSKHSHIDRVRQQRVGIFCSLWEKLTCGFCVDSDLEATQKQWAFSHQPLPPSPPGPSIQRYNKNVQHLKRAKSSEAAQRAFESPQRCVSSAIKPGYPTPSRGWLFPFRQYYFAGGPAEATHNLVTCLISCRKTDTVPLIFWGIWRDRWHRTTI